MRRQILATTLVGTLVEAKLKKAPSCTALVMSGGGSNGAWESGALWGLVNYGRAEDYKYDVVSGVSIGSINASGLAVFGIGDELAAVDFIYSTWQNISSEDIFIEWPMGLVSSLYSESIYDTTPGFKTL